MIKEMNHLSKMSIPIFLHHFRKTSNCFILMQTPLQSNIWWKSYEEFVIAKNNIKHCSNTILTNISKTIWPTSDSFLLIMSHMKTVPMLFMVNSSANGFVSSIPDSINNEFVRVYWQYFFLGHLSSLIAIQPWKYTLRPPEIYVFGSPTQLKKCIYD